MSATEQSTGLHAEPEPAQANVDTPPTGEEIHLPGPSVIPLVVAIGTTLLVIGTTIDWIWSALGGVILIVSIGIWIRDVRRDVAALPEEHHH
jgi:hypothetical protein